MSKQKKLTDLWVRPNLKRKRDESEFSDSLEECTSVEVNEHSEPDDNRALIVEDVLDAVPDLNSQVTIQAVSTDGPNQPKDFTFPKCDFPGCGKRSAQSAWFNTWKWLDYDQTLDTIKMLLLCSSRK